MGKVLAGSLPAEDKACVEAGHPRVRQSPFATFPGYRVKK